MLINACGYATGWKWDYHEMQLRSKLEVLGILNNFDVLDFQRVGTPKENPDSQLSSTAYLRIFAQTRDPEVLGQLFEARIALGMQHFAGKRNAIVPHLPLF